MAKPILSPVTSINALVKGQPWTYQPAITGGGPVAAWSATGLPSGVTMSAATGKITGFPSVPGVYNVTLKARDSANVWSDALIFPMGVESLPFEQDGAVRININLQTGKVYSPQDGADTPLYAKVGDKLLISVGFEDGGILQELSMMGLINVAMKVWDDEQFIPLNDGNFKKTGDYDTTRYLTTLDFDSDPRIRAAFDEFEDPHGTGFIGLGEIAWTWFTWQAGFTVPRQHVRTSRNFSLATFRDLDPTQRTIINSLPG